MNKENITKGEFIANNCTVQRILIKGKKHEDVVQPTFFYSQGNDRLFEQQANAKLIAEAFSAFTETNLTPKELKEENEKMKSKLQQWKKYADDLDNWQRKYHIQPEKKMERAMMKPNRPGQEFANNS